MIIAEGLYHPRLSMRIHDGCFQMSLMLEPISQCSV